MTDNPMQEVGAGETVARRCGARTRSGAPCKSAPVTGRRRCRMHGGAEGSGGPTGARNGNFRHGHYSKEVAATRRWLREARAYPAHVYLYPACSKKFAHS
jgi:hypothetical protein